MNIKEAEVLESNKEEGTFWKKKRNFTINMSSVFSTDRI